MSSIDPKIERLSDHAPGQKVPGPVIIAFKDVSKISALFPRSRTST